MNAVPITSCGQCPTCKTYVPIPPNLLAQLTASHPSQSVVTAPVSNSSRSFTTVPVSNQVPISTYSSNPSYNHLNNPIITKPMVQPMTYQSNYSLSEYENSWRSKFLKMPVLIHGIIQIVLILLIIILEITSLGLSTYSATGAGIWCSIFFLPIAISTVFLVKKWDRSRLWATRVLIGQIILIIFCFIIIGIVGSFVSSNGYLLSLYSTSITNTDIYGNNFKTKYQIMQAQLAFSILLLFSGFAYIIFYSVITYLALWKPFHTLDIPHLFKE